MGAKVTWGALLWWITLWVCQSILKVKRLRDRELAAVSAVTV